MVDFPYKIVVPYRPGHLVTRPRLISLLSGIVDRRLITLSAPAGYGKTSLLIDLANGPATLPICWYTLDSADRDVWVFLNYLTAAVEHRFPGALKQTRQLLSGNDPAALNAVFTTFARDLYAIGEHFAIIIDDWHQVDHIPEIANSISQLLLHCPFCHLILASRGYPSLSNVMLLAARRQMVSLDEQQLCFTAEEAAAVLSTDSETPITLEQASNLTTLVHGWITGIMLLFQTPMLPSDVRLFSTASGERQVYRFLTEQVLDQQPADVRMFLLESSLLDDLTSESCDALFERMDSRRLLEALLRRHLFISEIKPGVLRYQPLFREFLQQQFAILDPQRYRTIALKVADAYATQGQWALAFNWYMAIGDRAGAQGVIAASGERLYASGRLETLEHWFSALLSDDLEVPLLCLKARVLLDRGRIEEAQTLADRAEVRARIGDQLDTTSVVLLQAQIARITGKFPRALELARYVLNVSTQIAQRAAALRTSAICRHRLDETNDAIEEFKQALTLEQELGNLHGVAQIQRDLGICYSAMGLLRTAEDYYTRADTYWASVGNIGLRAMSQNSKGGTQHLMGRFQEAQMTLSTALQYAREAAMPSYQAAVLSNLGDLYSDLQLWDLARTAYEDARRIGGSAYLMHCLELSSIRLLTRQQQYEEAASKLRQIPDTVREMLGHEVLLLESVIACGLQRYDQAAAAIHTITTALTTSDSSLMILARAYLVQAQLIARRTPSDYAQLVMVLERAMQVAQRIGHDTFLVTEMLHMRDVQRRAAMAGWAPSEAWHVRQQDMMRVAQALGQNDKRPVLTIRTLGMDQILLDDQEVNVGWQKAREVLYYLLAHPDGVPIDTLREAIWPNLLVERSRDALRSAIYQLRSVLPRELITLQGRQLYRIDRSAVRIHYDCEQFLHILDKRATDREALLEGLDLYHGPFLPSAESEWSAAQRTYLERRYLEALRLVAVGVESDKEFSEAETFYRRILATDGLDEAAHAGVMRCLIMLGNRGAAINQYQLLRRSLDEELGIDPSPDSEPARLYLHALNA